MNVTEESCQSFYLATISVNASSFIIETLCENSLKLFKKSVTVGKIFF